MESQLKKAPVMVELLPGRSMETLLANGAGTLRNFVIVLCMTINFNSTS
jgi:hypothetical protein